MGCNPFIHILAVDSPTVSFSTIVMVKWKFEQRLYMLHCKDYSAQKIIILRIMSTSSRSQISTGHFSGKKTNKQLQHQSTDDLIAQCIPWRMIVYQRPQLTPQSMTDPPCTHSHCRNTFLSLNTRYMFIMQVVFIPSSSERCCYVRLSQYCHWSSLLSKQLQVGLVHWTNAVATALSQKKQLHTLSKIYAAPLIKSHTLQVVIIQGGCPP